MVGAALLGCAAAAAGRLSGDVAPGCPSAALVHAEPLQTRFAKWAAVANGTDDDCAGAADACRLIADGVSCGPGVAPCCVRRRTSAEEALPSESFTADDLRLAQAPCQQAREPACHEDRGQLQKELDSGFSGHGPI